VQGPENRDELQPELDNNIPLRFIPIFGAHIKNIYGHTKKDISILFQIQFLRGSLVRRLFPGED
jgi:hypothetical protein